METVKTYNCLVVDDEPPAREVLQRYIAQIPMLNLIAECANALQATMAIKQQHIDIIFLDIQMPQITGLELIRTLINPPKIILTTAFEQYAVKAFELDATDYLVKPIRFDRFLKAVMKALPEQDTREVAQPVLNVPDNANHAFLYFRADRKMVKVLLNEIQYVESLKDYVKIYTTKTSIITKYAIASLETMLPAGAFLRVHRSYLVSLHKVDSYTSEEVNIAAAVIPIGKVYRQQVLKALTTAKT
jgi:DNA-binding LytR/AlgR family response regulator